MEIKPPTRTSWTPDQLKIRYLETCLVFEKRKIKELEEKIKQLEKEKIK
jgi:hypothetical protein